MKSTAMICPVCQCPTTSMVYRRGHKLCADCANPNFLRMMDLQFGMMGPDIAALVAPVCATYMRERYGAVPDYFPDPRPSVDTANEVRAMLDSIRMR